jgi:hypothetical protein
MVHPAEPNAAPIPVPATVRAAVLVGRDLTLSEPRIRAARDDRAGASEPTTETPDTSV